MACHPCHRLQRVLAPAVAPRTMMPRVLVIPVVTPRPSQAAPKGPKTPPKRAVAVVTGSLVGDLHEASMKLHKKDPAQPKPQSKCPVAHIAHKRWVPTREGYLRFLVESKVIYSAFEEILSRAPYDPLWEDGLERASAIDTDIVHIEFVYDLMAPAPAPDGVGSTYAARLRELADTNPPAFICHFYNFFFAHAAGGGRKIGRSVSNVCLDGWEGSFYKYRDGLQDKLDAVRQKIDRVGEQWTAEQRAACVKETGEAFKAGTQLFQLIAGYKSSGHLL